MQLTKAVNFSERVDILNPLLCYNSMRIAEPRLINHYQIDRTVILGKSKIFETISLSCLVCLTGTPLAVCFALLANFTK